jgi:6,7-dimethyl-8-ribityllumazine synthase
MKHAASSSPAALVFAKPPKVLIVEARFYNDLADLLLAGAKAELNQHGATYDVLTVPGALEIPAAVMFARGAGYDGFVALGCVIRGETTHYDVVAGESNRALMDMTVNSGICLGNGILTVENESQALDRADPARQNKGGGAARAALEMILIRQKFNVKL